MDSDKYALSCIEIHRHVSTIRVLYKNIGEIQLPKLCKYFTSIPVKHPDGGNMFQNFNTRWFKYDRD